MKNPTVPLETSMANFHECEWKERALKAEAKLAALNEKIEDFLHEGYPEGHTVDSVVKWVCCELQSILETGK